jgi:Protein of unknown function (DUF3800)
MLTFDDYIMYVDESGDHGLTSIDSDYPIFVLSFCLFKKNDYAQVVLPAFTNFKFKYFQHDQVILHERDIRRAYGEFRILQNPQVRSPFLTDLSNLVKQTPFILFASVIRKDRLRSNYVIPANPYNLALAFGLERVFLHLKKSEHCKEGTLQCVFEERGKKEDADLELEFRRTCARNATGNVLPFNVQFANKQTNSAGLQLADLTARPIGRRILNSEQANQAAEIVWKKFKRDPRGNPENWGLKVFP